MSSIDGPTPQGPLRIRMGLSRQWGAVFLAAAALVMATLAGLGTLGVAMDRAQVQFDQLLEDKALSRALRVRRDLQLAANLGIPIAEIRGMHEYSEAIPAGDPDIRFIAVTDLGLTRLHYGGIGRRRLDPLLADPRLKAEAQALLSGAVAVGTPVTVGEFAITTLPIVRADGTAEGYVHVAVQARQLRERFGHEITRLFPIAALALLLVLELASFSYGSGYRDPLNRLEWLLRAAAAHKRGVVLSGRHAGGDLGAALFQFNAVMHRLGRRTARLLGYAAEVRGAVFEPAAVAKIDAIERATREEAAEFSADSLTREIDPRASDMRLPLVAGMTVALLAMAWPLMKNDMVLVPIAAALCFAGLLLGTIPRLPVAALSVVFGSLVAGAALEDWRVGGAWVGLGMGAGALTGLAIHYLRKNRLNPPLSWIAMRILTAVLLAALALVSADGLEAPPLIAALALVAAALTLVFRAPVRRLMFGRPPPHDPDRGLS